HSPVSLFCVPLSVPSSLPLSPPCSTLFPSTTLFRSVGVSGLVRTFFCPVLVRGLHIRPTVPVLPHGVAASGLGRTTEPSAGGSRSEEHTSELQARFDLRCRLLLERKKRKTCSHNRH